jgi:putative transposase
MVERLRRLDWTFERSPIYFVTACTIDRRKILASAGVHERLIEFAEKGPEFGAWLGAYVLMPDHLHALVALDGFGDGLRPSGKSIDGDGHSPPLQLGGWMKSLKNSLSSALRTAGIPGPHWQKGYFDHVLRSEESYAEKWEYVRHNPVRAGLVATPEAWPYFGQPFPLEFRHDL